MANPSPPRTKEDEFWSDFAQRMLKPLAGTIAKVLVPMLLKSPLNRIPPELVGIAQALRAARRGLRTRSRS